MTKKVQEDTMIVEEETALDIEKIDNNNVIVTSTNKHGVMKTRLLLFPKEVFQ